MADTTTDTGTTGMGSTSGDFSIPQNIKDAVDAMDSGSLVDYSFKGAGMQQAQAYRAQKAYAALSTNPYYTGTKSPTVITDSNIREKTMPQNENTYNRITTPNTNTGTNGNTGNGTNTNTGNGNTGTSTGGTDTSGGINQNSSYEDIFKSLLPSDGSNPVATDPIAKSINDLVQSRIASNDATTASYLDAIKKDYESQVLEQKQANVSEEGKARQGLEMSGGRYTPLDSSALMSKVDAAGIQSLNKLTSDENVALAKVQQAHDDRDYQLMDKEISNYNDKRKEIQDQAKTIYDNYQKQKATQASNVSAAVKDVNDQLLKSNAPKSVFDAVQKAATAAASTGDTSQIYAAAAGYGVGNGEITDINGSKALVDKTTGNIIKWIGGGSGSGSGSGGSTTDTTQAKNDFLVGRTAEQAKAFNSLPESDKASVMQLINGDALLTDVVKSRGKDTTAQINKLVTEATSIDPTFSINRNKVRYEFMKDWNDPNSKLGQSRNSINTALGHLADVSSLSKQLTPSDLQVVNKTQNWWDAKTGNANITNLQFGLTQLATEIATAYKGGSPSQDEIDAEKAVLGTQFSKSQFQGVFNTAASFLSSKVTSTRYQYKQTMGKEYNQPIIDPDKRQALVDSGIDDKSIVKENTPGNESVGSKINTALSSVDPATGKNYSSEDIIHQLIKDPQYKDKVIQAIQEGHSNDEIISYMKTL